MASSAEAGDRSRGVTTSTGRSRAKASVNPRLWLSCPALPSLNRQIRHCRVFNRSFLTALPDKNSLRIQKIERVLALGRRGTVSFDEQPVPERKLEQAE